MKIVFRLSLFVMFFVSFQVHGMTLGQTITDLPLDILGEVLKFTEIKTLCVFGESCKKFQNVSSVLFLRRYVASLENDYKSIPLVFAAKRGDLFALQKILPLKIKDVNKVDCYGRTPLYCAVDKGLLEIVKLLLEYNADVNKISDSVSPLFWAVWRGDTEVVKILLKHNADVNKVSCGYTPLLWATEKGYTEIVKLLLEHQADKNITDSENRTPLYWARYHGHLEIIKLLKAREQKNKVRNIPFLKFLGKILWK